MSQDPCLGLICWAISPYQCCIIPLLSYWTCHQAESRASGGLKSLTNLPREANNRPQFSWISPYLCEYFNYIPPVLVSTLGRDGKYIPWGWLPLLCPLFSFPSSLRAIRNGFFSFMYVRSFPSVPHPLHSCDGICSVPFLGAMMAEIDGGGQERN